MKIVWNDEKVLIDETSGNKEYKFEDFTGNIAFGDTRCLVEHASFTIMIRNIKYITGEAQPVKPWDAEANEIVWENGTVVSGDLRARQWNNGVFNGRILRTDEFVNGTFNGCSLLCNVFKDGIVEDCVDVKCNTWERGTCLGCCSFTGTFCCGVFRGGTFEGTWLDGHFKKGIFRGKWKGGTWFGGNWQGESYVGDGTFASVRKGDPAIAPGKENTITGKYGMDAKFEGKPIVRDIEICRKCKAFKTAYDPLIENDGWHWGIGVYCNNFPHNIAVGWCAETPHAVSEEEFVRATIHFIRPDHCPQYKGK